MGWPQAIVATVTLVGVILNYFRTGSVEKNQKVNKEELAVKITENTKLTEQTNCQVKAVSEAVNGRIDLLLKTYADLAIIQAQLDGTLTMEQIQVKQAERILEKNKDRSVNIAKLSKGFGVVNHKVLVVEDDPNDAYLFSKVLLGVNFTPIIAKNSKEMVTKITETHFSAAFIDINLPGGLNGYELIKIINMVSPDMPIFVVTGIVDARIESAIKLLGAVSIVNKPVTEDKLRELFNMSINSPEI